MPTYEEILVTSLFIGFMVWEYFTGVYKRNKRVKNEWIVDILAFGHLAVIKPGVMLVAFTIGMLLLPESQNFLSEVPFWIAFLIVFIPDDFSHYWIHRLAHEKPVLWPFHRTHHTATSYQASISFRENWSWFVIMPGFWWHGLMIYFGLIEQVILTSAIVGAHNVWLHNASNWDQKLYKNKFTRGPMKVVEYFINTPGLHRGHHGLGENSVPFGNYGQTLFIWDVIFNTATFKKGAIPEYYAVTNKEIMRQSWKYQLWWPFVAKQSNKDI